MNPDGSFKKFKARAVCQGFTQRPGIDYQDTYAPTLPLPVLRLLLAYAVQHGMDIHSMDAVTAFLNSPMDRDVYVEQFEGYAEPSRPRPEWVLKLNKALYGLKQSPLLWYQTLKKALESAGYTAVINCPCVFFKYAGPRRITPATPDRLILLMVFVDDLLICTKDLAQMTMVKEELHGLFSFTDQGRVSNHLGLTYQLDMDHSSNPASGSLSFTNVGYIDKMIERFRLQSAHPTINPLTSNVLSRPPDDPQFSSQSLYQEAVGALTWASITWRWDIATAVGLAARNVSAPKQHDWTTVKRILRYLKGTRDFYVKYASQTEDSVGLRVYSDADYAGDLTDRHSTTGILVLWNGQPVHWKSSKQSCIAQSTTEAEYIAAATAYKETLWLRQILAQITGKDLPPTPLHIDNQSAIALASSIALNQRTKHIDVRYHVLREGVAQGVVQLVDTPTEDQLADIFTKPLPSSTYRDLVNRISRNAHADQ
jgi:hypothetical protein